MKLVRFTPPEGEEVVSGRLNGEEVLADGGESFHIENVELASPVQPQKVVCVALNYLSHAEENSIEPPEEPSFFFKPPSAIIGPGDQIELPEAERVDYEGEIAVVIGRDCRNVSLEEAMDFILGYTCLNDVTNRDTQAWEQNWVRAKGFDTSAPIGPCIATPEEVSFPIAVKLRHNGKLRQNSNSADLLFGISRLIHELSTFMTLKQGDVISTGTPAGVGSLSPGDEVQVTVEGVGTLSNTVR